MLTEVILGVELRGSFIFLPFLKISKFAAMKKCHYYIFLNNHRIYMKSSQCVQRCFM